MRDFRGERAPWENFPPVIRNGDLGILKQQPEYSAAKKGDYKAALTMIDRLLTPETVWQIQSIAGPEKPLLVPVLAVESAGNNRIPLAFAAVLAQRTGFDVERGILQRERVARTNSGADHRLAFIPTFTGPVRLGQSYLILDDSLAMGGTIASLRGYIENRGGHVLAAAVMTAFAQALDIKVTPRLLAAINQKHGPDMAQYWKEETGYGLEQLTQGEAGHIRKAQSVDALRTRIA
jgi:hypothetical protein